MWATVPAPWCSKRRKVPASSSPGTWGPDGSLRHLLKCDTGGYLFMNGREIFRHAVRAVVDSSLAALGRAGLEAADVDVFVPTRPTPASSPRP